jgi:uncharacterized membrane protein HdeD (DUF308 family)
MSVADHRNWNCCTFWQGLITRRQARLNMAQAFSTDVKRATSWSMALSVLMIIAGILAIASPYFAGLAITVVVGWLLLISAVLHLVYAFRGGSATAVIWEILLAIVYALIGFYVLANPQIGLAALTFAIAFFLFVEAILELAFSYQLRNESGAGWILVDGIITMILAFLIWANWPNSSVWAVGVLVGVSMLFSGIARVMITSNVRRITTTAA